MAPCNYSEVLEIELELLLRSGFPRDLVEPVPRGEFGGDVVHPAARPCWPALRHIIWESKRTKTWRRLARQAAR
jgi:hypothetical protein